MAYTPLLPIHVILVEGSQQLITFCATSNPYRYITHHYKHTTLRTMTCCLRPYLCPALRTCLAYRASHLWARQRQLHKHQGHWLTRGLATPRRKPPQRIIL